MGAEVVQLRQKGVFTLPADLRQKYNLRPGDLFTLIDLGDGAFVLSPKVSTLARLGDQLADKLEEEDVSVEEIMQTLDEERQHYYRERYLEPQ
jgi:bifunctional DNA-binding transcriptional regulator/antitoxin component of YhaV-PrlF toxin-antitoxin module